MKTLKTIIFTLALFALSLSSVNGNYSNASTVEMASEEGGVSEAEIINYLEDRAYKVQSLISTETSDVIADTQYEYQTIVYIQEGIIVGIEDIR